MTPTSNNEISNKIYINAVFRGTFTPETSDGAALGSSSKMFSDLFLASGAVINFNNSDVTLTHSTDALTFDGASNGFIFGNTIRPSTNDGSALGTSSVSWADLFLASGAVINFNNSDVTLTHSSDQLTIGGLGAYTIGSTGGLQVNQDIVTTSGAIYALGGSIPISASVPGVYFGKESANNNRAIQIVTAASGSAYIDFAPPSVDFDGRILVDTVNHIMAFSVNGAEEVRISNTATYPSTSDGNALGTATNMWSDIFLATGAVINFNNGDVTLTHSANTLSFGGASSGYNFDANIYRESSFFLGFTTVPYILFDNAGTLDYVSFDRPTNTFAFIIESITSLIVTSSSLSPGVNDGLTLGTASTAYSDLYLASGAVINFNNSDVTLTHSTDVLTVGGGDLRVTTAGSNANSVATLTGSQQLTNKIISITDNTLTGVTALAGNQNLTGGFTTTSDGDGTVSAGTYTPDPLTGNFKHITANGAFTLGVPSGTCTIIVEVLNGASAGGITTSSYTKVTGDIYATTNTNKYLFFITKSNSYSHLHVQALQ